MSHAGRTSALSKRTGPGDYTAYCLLLTAHCLLLIAYCFGAPGTMVAVRFSFAGYLAALVVAGKLFGFR